jgi:hypothetical protein
MSSPPTSTSPNANRSIGTNGIPVNGREATGGVAVGGLANVMPSTDAVTVGDAVTMGDGVTVVVGTTTTGVTVGVGVGVTVGVGVGVTVGVGVGVTVGVGVGVGEPLTQLPLSCTLPEALTAKVSLLPEVLPDLLVSGVQATCRVMDADVLAPAIPVWVNA